MGQILQNWRVLSATLFAGVLIIGTYLLASGVEFPFRAQASAESELLQAIAARDTDGDGLPDWEETLYGTDPRLTDSFKLGMTDGAAVAKGLVVPKAIADIKAATSSSLGTDLEGLPPAPSEGTLTAAFTSNFIQFYLAARQANNGADLSEAQMQSVADQTIQSLASIAMIAPDFKKASDLTVSGSGADAMRAFAVNAETVLTKNTAQATTTQLKYLKYALNGDTKALDRIDSLAKAYRDSAVGIAALSVPKELVAADLALVNALMRLSGVTNDLAQVNTDPLATILALQQYVGVAQALGQAFIDIGKSYAAAGIQVSPGTPGASFVNLIANITARQQGIPKP